MDSNKKLERTVFILLPLILFGKGILQGKALYWGTPSLQFMPWWDFAWESIRAGSLPLWNPLVGMGAPLIANYQSAVFYPPHWIYFLMDSLGGITWMAWTAAVMVALHLSWAALGMSWLLDRMQVRGLGRLVGGLSFSLSGYLVARAGFLSITAAAAWIPWIMGGAMQLAREQDLGRALRLAGFFAMQFLAGHAQTAWYTVLLAGAWFLFWSGGSAGDSSWLTRLGGWLRSSAWLVMSGLMAGLAAAVQLLPTWQYLLNSQRAEEFGYLRAVTYSFWPWRFLSLIAPDLFGNPGRGDYWGYGNYWEDAVYFGFLPLVLAITAVVSSLRARKKVSGGALNWNRRDRKLIWFLCIVIGISFLLALGDHTPVFPFLYRFVPTFDLFQGPTRFTIWAVFSFSVLAALGVELLRPPTGKSLYWTRLSVAGSAALAVGAVLTRLVIGGVELTFIRAGAVLGIWAVGASLVLLLVPEEKRGIKYQAWKWCVVGLIGLDLITAGWKLNPTVEAAFYEPREPSSAVDGRVFMAPEDEYDIKFETFFRFDSFQSRASLLELRDSYLPNLNMLDGIPSANNFDPLVPKRYRDWIAAFEQAEKDEQQLMLDLMNVGILIEPGSNQAVVFRERSGFRPDRITFFDCAREVESEDRALEMVMSGTFEAAEQVLIETGSAGRAQTGCTAAESLIDVQEEQPGKLVLQVSADQPGWVVWSQVMYPGWRGSVNGEPEPIRPANFLFQALPVGSGTTKVVFQYRPAVFVWGLAITLAAVFTGGGYWIYQRGLGLFRRE